MGGDGLDFEEDPSSPAAGLLDIKIHVNSTISDAHRGAQYRVADINNFYLGNPMKNTDTCVSLLKTYQTKSCKNTIHMKKSIMDTSTVESKRACMD